MIPIQIGQQKLELAECRIGGNHLALALKAYEKFKGNGVYMSSVLCNECRQSITVRLREGAWTIGVEEGWTDHRRAEAPSSSCFPIFQSKETILR